jgi:anti-sigma factor RsiW
VDCTMMDAELVAFHLGALDGEPRAAVEAHLPGCARCVRAWLDLKRAVEREDDAPRAPGDRPSELARARLRSAVAREFGPRRKLLVAGGVAAAAWLAALLIHGGRGARDAHDPNDPAGAPRAADTRAAPSVDTAAPSPGSLNVW